MVWGLPSVKVVFRHVVAKISVLQEWFYAEQLATQAIIVEVAHHAEHGVDAAV